MSQATIEKSGNIKLTLKLTLKISISLFNMRPVSRSVKFIKSKNPGPGQGTSVVYTRKSIHEA